MQQCRIVSQEMQDRLPRGEVLNLLFDFFEGSNEEIIGREQKEKVIW